MGDIEEALRLTKPPWSTDDVEEALKMIKPPLELRDNCHWLIVSAFYAIAIADPDVMPSGTLKDELSAIATGVNSAAFRLAELPRPWRALVAKEGAFDGKLIETEINPAEFPHILKEIGRWADQLAERIEVPKSGAGVEARKAAAIKTIAARLAYDLLEDYAAKPPTLTKDGPYVSLAELLYQRPRRDKNASLLGVCTKVHRERRLRNSKK